MMKFNLKANKDKINIVKKKKNLLILLNKNNRQTVYSIFHFVKNEMLNYLVLFVTLYQKRYVIINLILPNI